MQSTSMHKFSITLLFKLNVILVLCAGNDSAAVVSAEVRMATANTSGDSSSIEDFFNFMQTAYQIKADVKSVSFGNATDNKEIEFELAVSKPAATQQPGDDSSTAAARLSYTPPVPTLELLNHDCSTAISEVDVIHAIVGEVEGIRMFNGLPYEVRRTQLDIDTSKLAESSIFQYMNDGEIGKMQFCVRADIGKVTVSPGVETSISFVKVNFDIEVNMYQGFSMVQEIATVGTGDGEIAMQEAYLTVTAMNIPDRPLSPTEQRAIETCFSQFLKDNVGSKIVINSMKIVAIDFTPEAITEIKFRIRATNAGARTEDVAERINDVMIDKQEEFFLNIQSCASGVGGFFDASSSFEEVTASLITSNIQFAYVDVDYGLDICVCDPENRSCYDSDHTISQNSMFMLCVSVDPDFAVISSISSLVIGKNGVAYTAIADSAPTSSITSMSSMGTHSEAVVTRILSIFFNNSESSTVGVSMIVLLRFASSSTRQLVSTGTANEMRNLGDKYDVESMVNFNIQLNNEESGEDNTALSGSFNSCGVQYLVMAISIGLAGAMFP